jgi:hypothetical protein
MRCSIHITVAFLVALLGLSETCLWADPPANQNLISDPGFANGFVVESPAIDPHAGGKKRIEGNRTTPWATGGPAWHLAQWNSRESVPPDFEKASPNLVMWRNQAKTIAIGRPGSPDEGIETIVNANYEFDSRYDPAQVKKAWPHLLLRQTFNDTPVRSVPLSAFSQLLFSAQFDLTAAKPVPRGGVGHYLIFFVIQGMQNNNEVAHLGLALYDNRYAVIKRWTGLEHEKHRLIYQLGFEDGFLQGDPRSGQWVDINLDLLPKIQEMVKFGSRDGTLSSANLRDYKLTGITLNWEVPGLGVFGSKIRRLQLVGK